MIELLLVLCDIVKELWIVFKYIVLVFAVVLIFSIFCNICIKHFICDADVRRWNKCHPKID